MESTNETNMIEDQVTKKDEVLAKPQSDTDAVPQKFVDAETGEVRVEALLKSYRALEQKLSEMVPAPNTPENAEKLKRVMGVPEKPEDYTVSVPDALMAQDPNADRRMHAKGFTPEQVQLVYDMAADTLVPMVSRLAADMSAESKAQRETEKLVEKFGGEENFKAVSRQVKSYADKNLPKDVVEGLSCSCDGVLAMYRMMKGEDGEMAGDGTVADPVTKEELQSMMRDPKYWRAKDPAFIEKVSKGFEKLYGEVDA